MRTQWSPTMGLRTATLTRESVRASKSLGVLSNAVGDTLDHMRRGHDLVDYRDLRPHECRTFLCARPWDHVFVLWWPSDPNRITTLRLVPVDGRYATD